MLESYRTLKAGASAIGEFTDRKSRFIAEIRPCGSEAQAQAFLAEVKAHYFDARHHVPAYVFADGRKRCSDDGEPSRTAGMPTLQVLEGAGLKDVCCVTTRYFGGTLLGPGGLVRAYAAAAQAAIEAASAEGSITEMTLVTPVVAEIPYSAYERVRRMAEDAGGKVTDSIFSADVQLTLAFRSGEEEAFLAALKELAAGEELAHALETRFAEF